MDDKSPILQIISQHTGDITACDISSTNLIVTSSSDKTVCVLEWKVGEGFIQLPYSPLKSHKYGVTSVKFSPQGTMFVSCSLDGTAIIWNSRTGAKVQTFVQSARAGIRRCAFSNDSMKLITASDDGLLCVWDLLHVSNVKNAELQTGDDASLQAIALSHDSELLLSGDSGGLLKLWSITQAENELELLNLVRDVHKGIAGCAFSLLSHLSVGNNKNCVTYIYIAATCGSDGGISLWQIEMIKKSKNFSKVDEQCNMILIQTLNGHLSDVHDVRFNISGTLLASTGFDKTVKIWEVKSGKCLRTLEGHKRYGNCCTFSKDSSLLVSGSNDKSIIIWNLAERNLNSELNRSCLTSSHFSKDEANANLTEELLMQKAETDEQIKFLQAIESSGCINTCCFSVDDKIAFGGGSKIIDVWSNTSEGGEMKCIHQLDSHQYAIQCVDFSPCGNKLVSCSMDGVLIHWDLQSGLSYEMKKSVNGLRTCKFSPKGDYIACAGDDGIAFLWDGKNLEFLKNLQQHDDAITCVAFSSDGKYLCSVSIAGDIQIYDFAFDSFFFYENAHDLGTYCCDFSMDKNDVILVTCGNDSLVKTWVINDSSILLMRSLSGHGGNVMWAKFSPCIPHLLISSATDNTSRIWNSKTADCIFVIDYHTSMVNTCAFSYNLGMVATGSLDKTVALWCLPEDFQNNTENFLTRIKLKKTILNWNEKDLGEWLSEMGFPEIVDIFLSRNVNSNVILEQEPLDLIHDLNLDEKPEIARLLWWLKQEITCGSAFFKDDENIPHEFLCPITHEVMREPVICSDGFTYERSAIVEWMLSGRFTSPMTNQSLKGTFKLNAPLKIRIYKYFFGEMQM